MSSGVSLTETVVWLKGVCVREAIRPLFLFWRRCCRFEFFRMYFWIISLKWLAFSSIALDYHIYIGPSNFYSYFILSHINIFENIFWSIIYNYPKKLLSKIWAHILMILWKYTLNIPTTLNRVLANMKRKIVRKSFIYFIKNFTLQNTTNDVASGQRSL